MSLDDRSSQMPPSCDAATGYARRGWPVFPLRPRDKRPLTEHGFEDATTDSERIAEWWRRWPQANVAIATGAPGPDVVDVDNPDALPTDLRERILAANPPTAASARGPHYYFAGTEDRGRELGYGQLKATGGYVVAPPSVHPSGKSYVWLAEPDGRLPVLPAGLWPEDSPTRGAGDVVVHGKVSHGERHDFLVDIAIRQVRGGILDEGLIITVLQAAFAQHCDPHPPPSPTEFRSAAQWALRSDIGKRERAAVGKEKKAGKKPKLSGPAPDAPLTEHRVFVERLAGYGPVGIGQPVRHGPSQSDGCDVPFENGLVIELARLEDIMRSPRSWATAVTVATNGHANPIYALSPDQRLDLVRSLCILASAPEQRIQRLALRDMVYAFLALAAPEPVELVDGAAKYDLIARHHARPNWRPDREVLDGMVPMRPWLIEDRHEDVRYVVSGQLFDYLRWRGQVNATDYEGRLSSIGLSRMQIHGREPSREGVRGVERQRKRLYLVEIPRDWLFVDDDDDD